MLENLDETERSKIVEYLKDLGQRTQTAFINGHTNSEHVENPVPGFAACLVKCASLSAASAKKQARELIVELETRGWIDCRRNAAGRIKSIKIIRLADPLPTLTPKVRNLRKEREANLKTEEAQALALIGEVVHTNSLKEEALERGERNEKRFYELMLTLGDVVAKLTNTIKKFEVRRSRKCSSRDMRGGEDVAIFIKTARKKWKFVYNVKSSWAYAEKFNSEIYLMPEQEGIDSKKATVTHEWKSDRRIINNILDDFIKAGLVEIKPVRRLIAYQFSRTPPKP